MDEYLALRVAAGLSAMSAEGATTGLPGSWCAACLRSGDALIGMGRVVGDGGLFLFVWWTSRWPRPGRGADWDGRSWPT